MNFLARAVPSATHLDPSARLLNTLTRYILKQHIGPFTLGLALIVFVLLLNFILQMMDRVLSKGLSADEAAQLLLYNLAWIIALAVPMAVLIAVLMGFGRMAADNEIMAAHSCGIGLGRLLLPVLGAAAVLTGLMMLFNDQVLPEWNHQARTLTASLKRRKAALVLKEKEGLFIDDLGAYNLLVRRVDEASNRLYGITLYDGGGPGPPTALHAASGQVLIAEDGGYIRLTLFDGEFHRIAADAADRFARGTFARQVIHIRDESRAMGGYRSSYRGDREMDYGDLRRAIDAQARARRNGWSRIDSTLDDFVDGLAEAAGDSAHTARTERLRQRIRRQHELDANRVRNINRYLVELHKHFSIPTACLVFALAGAPLGILIRRRGAAVAVGTSLAFFWVYWMFLIGGEELADRGFVHPAVAMWAPNGIIGLLGYGLLRAADWNRILRARQTAPGPKA